MYEYKYSSIDSMSVTGKRSLPCSEAEILLFSPMSGKIFMSKTRENTVIKIKIPGTDLYFFFIFEEVSK
jgi:hypothetical protein